MDQYHEQHNFDNGFLSNEADPANEHWDLDLPTAGSHAMPSVHPIPGWTPGWTGMEASAPSGVVPNQQTYPTMAGSDNAGGQTLHMQATGLPESYDMQTCASCVQGFNSSASPEKHGKDVNHQPFKCACGKGFGRPDTLKRHKASACKLRLPLLDVQPRFGCPFCSNHDGNKAFARRDHLDQHLRGFHKFEKKGIAYLKERNDTNEAPALQPLNSATLLAGPLAPELDGMTGQNLTGNFTNMNFMDIGNEFGPINGF